MSESTDYLAKLCEVCRAIPSDFFVDRYATYDHHLTYAALQQAAIDGCGLCSMIVWQIEHVVNPHLRGYASQSKTPRLVLHRETQESTLHRPATAIITIRGILDHDLRFAEYDDGLSPYRCPDLSWLDNGDWKFVGDAVDEAGPSNETNGVPNDDTNKVANEVPDEADQVAEELAHEVADGVTKLFLGCQVTSSSAPGCPQRDGSELIELATGSQESVAGELDYVSDGQLNEDLAGEANPDDAMTDCFTEPCGEYGWERRPVAGAAAHKDALMLIPLWLNNCVKAHMYCNKKPAFVPTRLLDVESGCESSVRLISTSGDLMSYFALSHCWGQPSDAERESMSTTKSNLAARQASVSVAELPRTFRDFVWLARSIRVRYVWIDSLCIIQDSEDDWLREAKFMGQIYQSALCTIAAMDSHSPNDGLFQKRATLPPSVVMAFEQSHGSDEPHRTFLVHPSLPSWEEAVEGAHLSSRGWTVQERQLSSRIVSFTKHQMFWECSTSSACETYPYTGLDRGRSNIANRKYIYVYMLQPNTIGPMAHTALTQTIRTWREMSADEKEGLWNDYDNSDVKPPTAYMAWYALVKFFSARHFTYSKDILPAIAGIAADLALKLDDTYVAGLWRKDLAYGLLWGSGFAPEPRPHWRAPSWSWASVSSPVKFYEEHSDPTYPLNLEILDVGTTPYSSRNPYGAVSDGFLQVRGVLARGKLHWESYGFDDTDKRLCVIWDNDSTAVSSKDRAEEHVRTWNRELDQIDFDATNDSLVDGQEVYGLYLNKTPVFGTFGLALLRSQGAENTYVRIGLLHINRNSGLVRQIRNDLDNFRPEPAMDAEANLEAFFNSFKTDIVIK